jgi:hypothetical protein
MVGTSGLFHVPTANVPADRTIILGSSYIPMEDMPRGFLERGNQPAIYDALTAQATVVFLPSLEVMFRYTGNLKMNERDRQTLFMDRMLSARLRLWKEGELIPAVLLGYHDMGSYSYFESQYLVASKHIDALGMQLGLHAGYAFDLFGRRSEAYRGSFGGIALMPLGDERLELILEHDSHHPNAALRIQLFSRLSLMAGLYELRRAGFQVSLRHTPKI